MQLLTSPRFASALTPARQTVLIPACPYMARLLVAFLGNEERVGAMESNDLKSMSVEELWTLYEEITAGLRHRIVAERSRLEERLRKIESGGNIVKRDGVRRPYPKVLPKYQNPKNPAETWAGRGKQPRWLTTQLRSGKKLDDFRIDRLSVKKRRRVSA